MEPADTAPAAVAVADGDTGADALRRGPAGRLRPQAGRVRRRPPGRSRARSSASSATTAAARARRSAPSSASTSRSAGASTFDGKDVTGHQLAPERQGRHGDDPVRALRVRRHDGHRQPAARRRQRPRRRPPGQAHGARARAVPDPRRALRPARRHDVGRPAAHGQPGHGADGQPQAADARRAVARPGPGRRAADLRHRAPPRRHRGPRRAAARAERRPGAAHRRPLLRHALGPRHPRGDRRADAAPATRYWDLF